MDDSDKNDKSNAKEDNEAKENYHVDRLCRTVSNFASKLPADDVSRLERYRTNVLLAHLTKVRR
jgi:hypothetical protein